MFKVSVFNPSTGRMELGPMCRAKSRKFIQGKNRPAGHGHWRYKLECGHTVTRRGAIVAKVHCPSCLRKEIAKRGEK